MNYITKSKKSKHLGKRFATLEEAEAYAGEMAIKQNMPWLVIGPLCEMHPPSAKQAERRPVTETPADESRAKYDWKRGAGGHWHLRHDGCHYVCTGMQGRWFAGEKKDDQSITPIGSSHGYSTVDQAREAVEKYIS